MEYLDGETLGEILKRRRRLPPAEAVRIAYQTLQGLQYLHEQRTVHWNIDPTHLMLVPVPALGQPDTTLEATVKLLDAGLGQPLFNVQVQDAREKVVEHGAVVLQGQVDYLAPELAIHPLASPPAGPAKADIRADVYSVGCLLYHCLAGQPPFPGGSHLDRLIRHATESPHPLSAINPEVSEGLQLVVARMMAREPAQRYPDPGSAARALLAFLPAEKITTPVPLAIPVGILQGKPARPEVREVPRPLPSRKFRPVDVLIALAGLVFLLLLAVLWFRKGSGPEDSEDSGGDLPQVAHPRSDLLPPKPIPKEPSPPDPAPKPDPEPKDTTEPPTKAPAQEPPPEEKKPPNPSSRGKWPTRVPIPSEKEQARAEALIRELFRSDYARPTQADRRALAQKLLRQGIDTWEDAGRFVLLREARDLAAQGADLELALRALKELCRHYDLDEMTEKVKVTEQTAKAKAGAAAEP
jgi:hypothetical protein